jgi:acyl-CoA synthetase (AMP-forming)/AMP-acid ligase II
MYIDFMLAVFRENLQAEAMVWKGKTVSYAWLLERFEFWCDELAHKKVQPGTVVAILGDYSPNSIALMLALIQKSCIVVPLTVVNEVKRNEYIDVAMSEACFTLDADDNATFATTGRSADHEYYRCLRDSGHPALVLFTSGSTGAGKAAVHDFARLLEKYKTRRQNLRTLTFLLYDHIGGVDTMLYSLSNGSCIITVQDRLPDTVCRAIQDHNVQVLPVSPSFLNMLILSESYTRYDMSSLTYITYGAEVMPLTTLKKCAELFPGVTLLQKFGTTEVGTLRSKSRSNESTWVKIGGEGYQTRVVDGILHIKAQSAILGYLNAPSPFTDDGWFITNDLVEVDGDYMRILGRKQEVINVGGEKVNPAEVENVIYELGNVNEVSIFGEHNAILGNIICAKVSMVDAAQDRKAFINQIKAHCAARLERYKVPVKIEVVDYRLHSDRFKKMRLTLGTHT